MDPELVPNLLLAGGAILAAITAWHVWRAVDLFQNGIRTEGIVTRHTTQAHEQWQGEGRGSETVRLDYPHVEFALRDGSRVEFKSRLQIMKPAGLERGATVMVLYNPKAPAKTAEIVGPRTWFAVLIQILPSGILAVMLLYYAAQYKGWTRF
jgi:Protein of unknown function (DUF3592)